MNMDEQNGISQMTAENHEYITDSYDLSGLLSITIVRKNQSDSSFSKQDVEDWLTVSDYLETHEGEFSTFYRVQEQVQEQVQEKVQDKVIVIGIKKNLQQLGDSGRIRTCKYCGKLFFSNRKNADYCERIIQGTETCYSHGPRKVYRQKLLQDPARFVYGKAYKKMQSRLRRDTISSEEFDQWRNLAKRYLAHCKAGKMSQDEYQNWIDTSTERKRKYEKLPLKDEHQESVYQEGRTE